MGTTSRSVRSLRPDHSFLRAMPAPTAIQPAISGPSTRPPPFHAPSYAAGMLASFAIVAAATQDLIGAMGLAISAAHARAELGYWAGVPFWNRGYATEAGAMIVRFGFEQLGLNRIVQHVS